MTEREEKKICSKCGKELGKEEIGGTHFAGIYCHSCWEIYKKEHPGNCLICGSPRYSCVC